VATTVVRKTANFGFRWTSSTDSTPPAYWPPISGWNAVEVVARIVTAVASALDYAHKQDLLHRDVKPANIMLTHLNDEGEQRILLTDFGIVRNVNDISGLTKTNMTVGTVAYCAPEQLLGEDVDGRTDQYTLAATALTVWCAPGCASANLPDGTAETSPNKCCCDVDVT
jgi:serine/threonine protein kinase